MTKVTREDLDLGTPIEMATDRTLDETQRKRLLVYLGQARFVVNRKYLDGVTVATFDDDPQPEVVYDGPDLNEAIRIYNGLS